MLTSFVLGAGLAGAVSFVGVVDSSDPPDTEPLTAEQAELPLVDFFGVPQLGDEPVAGSGCGGDGSLGPHIPDGLWRGRLVRFDGADALLTDSSWPPPASDPETLTTLSTESAAALELDVDCAYLGEVGRRMFDEFMADHPDYGSPPYINGEWIVNNNQRARIVPLADDFRLLQAEWVPVSTTADGGTRNVCQVVSDEPPPSVFSDSEVWVHIVDGAAVYTVVACPHD